MRRISLVCWLLIPMLAGAYHYGPGQERLRLDRVGALLADAQQCADDEIWSDAVQKYEEALALLPKDRLADSRRIRLQQAKAQMFCKQLPDAHQSLKLLVDELQADDQADPEVVRDAREALANSQYYITWLMRLEGHAEPVWKPEIEAARQTYRLLAEQAEADGQTDAAARNREDLEATIRLARMDLSDLQGLPLPTQ